MSATLAYPELLAQEAPAVITSERAYKAALKRVESLMALPKPTRAESKLLDLLVVLIEAYEDEVISMPTAPPVAVLKELMAARGMKQADLAKVLGSSGLVSDVLHGKRSLSKAHIGKLARVFSVSPAVFLDT